MWMDGYGVNVEDNPEIIPVLSEKSNDANTSKNNMLWGLSHFSKNIFFFSFYAQTKFKSVLMKRPADTLVIKAWFKFSIFPLGLEIIYIYAFFIQRIKSNFSQLFCSYNSHPIWLHRITSHMQKKHWIFPGRQHQAPNQKITTVMSSKVHDGAQTMMSSGNSQHDIPSIAFHEWWRKKWRFNIEGKGGLDPSYLPDPTCGVDIRLSPTIRFYFFVRMQIIQNLKEELN